MITDFTRAEKIIVKNYGQVGAGTVVDFIERGRVSIIRPRRAKTSDDIVSVTVSGDSLIDDHIYDGDRLTLRLNFEMSEVKDGRLVVAKLPCGSLTVKHIHFVDDGSDMKVLLKPANPTYPELEYDPDEVEIKALVLESVRSWE
jgi:SOS-response transcriptional repressor LexA